MNLAEKPSVRIAAVADLHVGRTMQWNIDYDLLFSHIANHTDVLLLCGDLTDHGTVDEAKQLGQYLGKYTFVKLAVLGNHDVTANESEKVKRALKEYGVVFLDETVYEIHNVGFAGVKGFGGGYGRHTLGGFGEKPMKDFVKEAISEAEALEIALDNVGHCNKKVVALHYSPIIQTNKGEPLEIYPFLGTTRLEEVIDRHDVQLVFHGHSHFGSPHGKTTKGADVYNVSLPVMQKLYQQKAYRIVEL